MTLTDRTPACRGTAKDRSLKKCGDTGPRRWDKGVLAQRGGLAGLHQSVGASVPETVRKVGTEPCWPGAQWTRSHDEMK